MDNLIALLIFLLCFNIAAVLGMFSLPLIDNNATLNSRVTITTDREIYYQLS